MKRVNKPLRESGGRAETTAKRCAKIGSKRTFIHRSADSSRLEGGGVSGGRAGRKKVGKGREQKGEEEEKGQIRVVVVSVAAD